MEQLRLEEATRLLQWIRDNQRDWHLICNHYEDIGDDELQRILKDMMDQSFYQMVLVLLSYCEKRPKSEKALTVAVIDLILAQEAQGGIRSFTKQVLNHFEL